MAQRICVFLFLIFTVGHLSVLRAEDFRGSVITDPSVSRRCEFLTEKRAQKLSHKQRILELIDRNKYLQKVCPKNKVSLKKRLDFNLGRLEQELMLTLNQIQYQEESIIRKGCPGISL